MGTGGNSGSAGGEVEVVAVIGLAHAAVVVDVSVPFKESTYIYRYFAATQLATYLTSAVRGDCFPQRPYDVRLLGELATCDQKL